MIQAPNPAPLSMGEGAYAEINLLQFERFRSHS